MEFPDNLKYAETHEWVRADDGELVTIGISDYAQAELTELVFIELPEVGREFSQGDEIAVVESVKSASDIYSPISGEVVEVNEELNDNPSLVNESAFDKGWMFKIKLSNASEIDGLLDAAAYSEKVN
ncbi:MAG: glycine cleavage system protein GcvH [Fuerstiella sp.]